MASGQEAESSHMASQRGGARDTSVSPQQAESSYPSVNPTIERLEIKSGQEGESSYIRGARDASVYPSEPRQSGRRRDIATLPEEKITWFAVTLAFLEKLASGLGDLAFIWATVVLLGGFASSLETADFWVVTTILCMESVRIFSRTQEGKWHHESMLRSMETLIRGVKRLINKLFRCSNNRNENSGADHDDSLNKAWMSRVSRILLFLQLFSACVYICLTIFRLVKLDRSGDSNSQNRNMKPALKIFYGLSLGESFLILLEKVYWLWMIHVSKLLENVNAEYGLGESGLDTVQRFFYDTYSRCVDRGIFDGSKMEFVMHNIELLLQSGTVEGQLGGAQVLSKLANKRDYAEKTLREIGTMRDVVERLIDILNFKNDHEQEIRIAAAEIISKLVENKAEKNNWDNINRDCIRVTAIDGFMESIASLLYSEDSSQGRFVLLGLTILQKLADERSNHDKIASSRGLLPKIIALMNFEPLERQKLALQIVETLASTTGSRGKALRKQIRDIVFSISNLRHVLQFREDSKRCLQILAINTLTSLASEPEGRQSIGSTGGVLHELLSLFFRERVINCSVTERDIHLSEKKKLVTKATEALGFLSLESELNCKIMMRSKLERGHPKLIESLISVLNETALNDTVQFIHVARILRNLLVHAKADQDVESSETFALAEKVPSFVTRFFLCQSLQSEEHSCEPLEAAIGLAAQFFNFLAKWNLDVEFEKRSGVSTKLLISKVVEVFQSHPYPLRKVPNIRRFSLELLIAVMEMNTGTLGIRPVMERNTAISEMRSNLVESLEGVMNTTSDWEYYNAFSGSMGLSRHGTSIRYLAEHAMELLPAS